MIVTSDLNMHPSVCMHAWSSGSRILQSTLLIKYRSQARRCLWCDPLNYAPRAVAKISSGNPTEGVPTDGRRCTRLLRWTIPSIVLNALHHLLISLHYLKTSVAPFEFFFLRKRNCQSFPLCNKVQESSPHLLVKCRYTVAIWTAVLSWSAFHILFNRLGHRAHIKYC
jgi:hypothetical protein